MPSTINDRLDGISTSVAIKAPCQAVATTNITLSGEQTVGGVAVVAVNAAGRPDRVACTGQTNPVENGIWDVSTGAWSRAKDFNGNRDVVQGTLIEVYRAAGLSPFYRVTSANPVLIGTSNITFEEIPLDADVLRADLATDDDTAKGAALVGWDGTTVHKALDSESCASMSAFITGSWAGVEQVHVRSFYGSWEDTVAGPQGPSDWHKDGTTGGTPTVDTTAAIIAAMSTGQVIDSDGVGWRFFSPERRFNVLSFGAGPVGVVAADICTDAINATISCIKALKRTGSTWGQGTLVIPETDSNLYYDVDDTILFEDIIQLKIDTGQGAHIVNRTNDTGVMKFTATSSVIFGFDVGPLFLSNRVAGTARTLEIDDVIVSDFDYIYVDNTLVAGSGQGAGDAIYISSSCSQNTFKNLIIEETGGNGVNNNGDYNRFYSVEIFLCGGAGFIDNSVATGTKVFGGHAYLNDERGWYFIGSNANAFGIIGRNNSVGSSGTYGGIDIGGTNNKVMGSDGLDDQGTPTQGYGYVIGSSTAKLIGYSGSGNTVRLINNTSATAWIDIPTTVGSDRGDASITVVVGVDDPVVIFDTPITADRTVTLSATNAFNGAEFEIIRTANCTGGFNINVGTGPLIALSSAGSSCRVKRNASAWILVP